MGDLALGFRARLAAQNRKVSDDHWPSKRYQKDPVGFCREVLGVEPWAKQVEILEAIRDHERVTIRSGHKCGKSSAMVYAALWYFCSFAGARVVMSSVTARQVDAILWRELKMVRSKAIREIDGEMSILARSGFKAADYREISGFTAREAEAVAGISGANLLYLVDEASGVGDDIFEAIEGNRAGGARIVMVSNPTRVDGEFFRSHTDKKHLYKVLSISSEDTPNAKSGEMLIPGLATAGWIQEKREEWGTDSALYSVRVKGEFARESETAVIGLQLVTEAEARWEETEATGPLHVGVDVARYGDDDTAIALRRGQKILSLVTFNGLSEPQVAARVMQALRAARDPREPAAIVKVDSCGGIGMKVCLELKRYEHLQAGDGKEITLVPVNVAEVSKLPDEFPLLRDQLWFSLRAWLKEGGAIPEDAKLSGELVAPQFYFDARQRRKVASKDDIRKRLKRSPDRADAVALAVWDPPRFDPVPGPVKERPARPEINAYELDGMPEEGGDLVYG